VFFALLAFVAAEVVAFVAVGDQIGFAWAVLLLIGVSALGPFAVRRVGLGVLARTQDRLAEGESPTREILDGVLVLAGGVMICVPGFISDALGLLLMLGPVRRIVLWAGGYWLGRRITTLRPVRWNATDVESRPTTGDTPSPLATPERMVGPAEHTYPPTPDR
jgi:UPF0716 protein FxsA